MLIALLRTNVRVPKYESEPQIRQTWLMKIFNLPKLPNLRTILFSFTAA